MEFDPATQSHGRNYHFLVSAVAPRPIGWTTTLHGDVVNLAPFSWFQAICADPPMVMLAVADRHGEEKDTLRNARETRELVINGVSRDLAKQMVATSADLGPDESEVEAMGIVMVPSKKVAPPRVRDSPYHLECKVHDITRYGGEHGTHVIVAEVVHIHADDAVLDERGNLDPHKVPLLARLGGAWYTDSQEVYEIRRPDIDRL